MPINQQHLADPNYDSFYYAAAWRVADPVNRKRILDTWPEYFCEYAYFAGIDQGRRQRGATP